MRPQQERADCGVRALAVACDTTYDKAYAALSRAGRKPRGTTWCWQLVMAGAYLGYRLTKKNTSKGATIRTVARELPSGRWIVYTAGHFIGVVEGIAIDYSEGTRKRIKWAFKSTLRN